MKDDEFINDDNSDEGDFDAKAEAAYLNHAGSRKRNGSRPQTVTQRPPISAEAKSKINGARHEYRPKVSANILREVRNTLTSTEGSNTATKPPRVSLNSRPQTANNGTTNTRRPKTPQEYLRMHREKVKKAEENNDHVVDQCARELHYSYLYKMGEMNEWCHALGLNTLYRAYKLSNGDLQCHYYEEGVFIKELSIKLMEKRYKTLQGRYTDACARGQIECDDKKHGDHALTEEEQQRRQQEIRDVLKETIQLTNKLKEQLLTLEKQDNRMTKV